MCRPAERGEAPGHHHRGVDRDARRLVEPPLQPACREPCRPLAVAERHERSQVEGIREPEAAQLEGGDLCGDDVARVDRSAEDGGRMALARDGAALRSGAELASGSLRGSSSTRHLESTYTMNQQTASTNMPASTY